MASSDLERRLAKVEQAVSAEDDDHSLRDDLKAWGLPFSLDADDATLFRRLLNYLAGNETPERLVSANERPKN